MAWWFLLVLADDAGIRDQDKTLAPEPAHRAQEQYKTAAIKFK